MEYFNNGRCELVESLCQTIRQTPSSWPTGIMTDGRGAVAR